jgi:hypothetical protein
LRAAVRSPPVNSVRASCCVSVLAPRSGRSIAVVCAATSAGQHRGRQQRAEGVAIEPAGLALAAGERARRSVGSTAAEGEPAVLQSLGRQPADLDTVDAHFVACAQRRQRQPAARLHAAVDARDARFRHRIGEHAVDGGDRRGRQRPVEREAGGRQLRHRIDRHVERRHSQVEQAVALDAGAPRGPQLDRRQCDRLARQSRLVDAAGRAAHHQRVVLPCEGQMAHAGGEAPAIEQAHAEWRGRQAHQPGYVGVDGDARQHAHRHGPRGGAMVEHAAGGQHQRQGAGAEGEGEQQPEGEAA